MKTILHSKETSLFHRASCEAAKWNSLLPRAPRFSIVHLVSELNNSHMSDRRPGDAVILFVRKHDGNSKNLSRQRLHIKFSSYSAEIAVNWVTGRIAGHLCHTNYPKIANTEDRQRFFSLSQSRFRFSREFVSQGKARSETSLK